MITLNRRYYDEYFFSVAEQTASEYNFTVIYDPIKTRWASFLQDNCLVFTQDYFTDGLTYNRLYPSDVDKIKAKQFYLVSSVYNAGLDLNFPSVTWLHAGSDMLFQQEQYKEVTPVFKKTYSDHPVVCLGLLPRPHRLITASLLLANNISKSCVFVDPGIHDNPSFSHFWPEHNLPFATAEKINAGWLELQQNRLQDHQNRYNVSANNNAENFEKNLRDIYKTTAVEIVMETTWHNRGVFVSEKFLHSVLGCNLPIVIGNPGTVEYLRNSGFDMFDDIINHSYDGELDPVKRIVSAIEDNIDLIKQGADANIKCTDRLHANAEYAQHRMHDYFCKTFKDSLSKFICNATNLA
jgi:hypothetical protein